MKTILKNGTYQRVSNEVAEREVAKGAKFASKSEWKKNVRDVQKVVVATEEVEQKQKTKSKKAEKRAKIKERQKQ
jgi:hypothetical protein